MWSGKAEGEGVEGAGDGWKTFFSNLPHDIPMLSWTTESYSYIISSLLPQHETLMSRLASHFPAVQLDLSVIGPLANGSQTWSSS